MEIIDHPLGFLDIFDADQEMYKEFLDIETILFKECFDILFSLCSYDMSDTLLYKLLDFSLESVPVGDQEKFLANFSFLRVSFHLINLV
jgi:hypothetical protein